MAHPSRGAAGHPAHGALERVHVAHLEYSQFGGVGHPAPAHLKDIQYLEKAVCPDDDNINNTVGREGVGGRPKKVIYLYIIDLSLSCFALIFFLV